MLLFAKLHDCYSVGRHSLHLFCPNMGQTCVARFEDSWYRAEVIGEALCLSVCRRVTGRAARLWPKMKSLFCYHYYNLLFF